MKVITSSFDPIIRPYVRILEWFLQPKLTEPSPDFGEQLAACLFFVMRQVLFQGRYAACGHWQWAPDSYAAVTDNLWNDISTLSRGFRNEHTQTRIMSNCQLLKNFWTRCMELGRDEMRALVLWRTVWRISMEYHTLGKLATSSSYVEIMSSPIPFNTLHPIWEFYSKAERTTSTPRVVSE